MIGSVLVAPRAHACVFTIVCLLSGCSCSGRKPASPATSSAARNEPVESEPVLDPILFDARGVLRASSEKVGSLEIPVGFRRKEGDEPPTFEGLVPIRAVHAFFRSRLVSGDIVEAGDALRFRGARAATSQGVETDVYDVAISPMVGSMVRIEITPRVTETPTESEDETRRRISEAWRRQSE